MKELDLQIGNATDNFSQTEEIFDDEDFDMSDDLIDNDFMNFVNDEAYYEEKTEEKPYGKKPYCKLECEFFEKCLANKESCVKNIFYQVLNSLTPREAHVIKLLFGIDDGRTRTLEEVGKVFNITTERIRQIKAKALRKLRHPSRSRELHSLDMCLVLLSYGESTYLRLWRSIFGEDNSAETLLIEFLEKYICENELKIANLKQKIARAEWQKKKIIAQQNITSDTTINECCFGDMYDGGVLSCEIPVVELRHWTGGDVFEHCNYNKKIFEEMVKVLLAHNISFSDYSVEYNLQTYFDKIYNAHLAKLRKNALGKTIEELELSTRTLDCLKRAEIDTVQDLILHTEDELKEIYDIDFESLKEIKKALASFGLCLLGSIMIADNSLKNKRHILSAITIEELDLSVRSYNSLKRAGIETLEDLTKTAIDDLLEIRNLGRKGTEEIIEKLDILGISLAKKEE